MGGNGRGLGEELCLHRERDLPLDRRRRELDAPRARRVRAHRPILVHPRTGTSSTPAPRGSCGATPDRGVYKTTDAGKTWTLVLRGGNLSTGCASLAMDPSTPTLAAVWDHRRKGWTFRSGGARTPRQCRPAASTARRTAAPTGRRSRTRPTPASLPSPTDGSRWRWPQQCGRRLRRRRGGQGALYRSGDGGKTWERRDDSQNMVWRPFYFATLIVDPTNPDRLFKPDGDLIMSLDGGKTFASVGAARTATSTTCGSIPRPAGGAHRGRRRSLARRTGQPLVEGEQPADLAVLPRQRGRRGSLPRLRRPAGQQLLGRPLELPRRGRQRPVGEHVRRRRLLDVRRSHG